MTQPDSSSNRGCIAVDFDDNNEEGQDEQELVTQSNSSSRRGCIAIDLDDDSEEGQDEQEPVTQPDSSSRRGCIVIDIDDDNEEVQDDSAADKLQNTHDRNTLYDQYCLPDKVLCDMMNDLEEKLLLPITHHSVSHNACVNPCKRPLEELHDEKNAPVNKKRNIVTPCKNQATDRN